jgi:hypothetical protein
MKTPVVTVAYDEHAGSGDVLADRLRARDDRGLGRRVCGGHRVSLLAGDGRDVHDSAIATRNHSGQHGPVAEEDPVGIRFHSSSDTSTVASDAPGTPAEQTRMSIGPSSDSTRDTASSTSAERETSVVTSRMSG